VTGAVTAGTVGVGDRGALQNVVFSTASTQIKVTTKMSFSGSNNGVPSGVDGNMLAMTFFANSFGGSQL
jgi:hypothetical protein